MSVTPTGAFIQTLENFVGSINNAAGQTKQTIVTPTANGTRVQRLFASSTDTSARDITIGVTISAVNYDLFTVQIPIQAGTIDSTPTVDIFNASNFPALPLDAYGNPYLDLKSGSVLYAYAPVTVTSGKQLNIFGFGGDL